MSENTAPEKVDYKGWKLFDKVIICAKPWKHWSNHKYSSDINGWLQGYVVESGNKKQLESGKEWAEYTEYGPYNFEKYEYEWTKVHPAQVYEFDNSGFTLELLESADMSSQGGKLSFWNCKITKDNKTFVIGIAADLLLDVLKTHTVINGVVQGPLMFARCKGGVGMLSTDMESYKTALKDMQAKAVMSKGKTSKHKVGKVYGTLQLANIYVGDFYVWYEPVYQTGSYNSWYGYYDSTLIGFKKLKTPKIFKYFPSYYGDKNKLSEYTNSLYTWELHEKLPKRVELATEIEMDVSREDLVNNWLKEYVFDPYKKACEDPNNHNLRKLDLSPIAKHLGISTSSDFYEFPEDIKEIIKANNYKLYDENNNIIY